MDWIKNNRGVVLIEGILLTLLGILAIAMPGISTLSTELFIGWLLFFSGLVQLYRTFKTRQQPGFVGSVLLSVMYIAFGLLLVIYPIAGIFSLTILLISFFIAEGIVKIYLAFQLKLFQQWGWLAFSGLIALFLAFIIWSGWPGTAFWVLGLLVGINLIFFGLSLIFLGAENKTPPTTPV